MTLTKSKRPSGTAPAELTSKLFQLLEVLLADAASDVEVVAGDLGLKDEMRERLQRGLDRVGCARGVLDAMREGRRPGEAKGEDDTEPPDDGANRRQAMLERVRGELGLLAEGWPQDYPAGAVELRLLRDDLRSGRHKR